MLRTGSRRKLWEKNRRRQDAGETKLKVEVEGEMEGVGKEKERNKLLSFNDTEAINAALH